MTIEKSLKLIGLVAQLKSLYKKEYGKSGKWFYFTSLDEKYYLDEHINNYKVTPLQEELSNKLCANEGIFIISYQPEDILDNTVYPIMYSIISFIKVLESDINKKQKRRALDDSEIRMLNICKLIECIYDGTDDYIEQENKALEENDPNKDNSDLYTITTTTYRQEPGDLSESEDNSDVDEEEELDIADSLDAKEAIKFIKNTEKLFNKINALYSNYSKTNSIAIDVKSIRYKVIPSFKE